MTDAYDRAVSYRYNFPGILLTIFLDGQTAVRISDKTRDDLGGYYWLGLVVNVSGMDQELPLDTKYKRRGDAQVKVLNSKLLFQPGPNDRFSDLMKDFGLLGAKVKIELYFQGLAYADCEERFYGTIMPPIKYDANYLSFTVRQQEDELKVPPYQVQSGFFPDMDVGSDGKPMILIVGEMKNEGVSGRGFNLDQKGGALSMNTDLKTETSPDRANLLIAGHKCEDVTQVWNLGYVAQSPNYDVNNNTGPSGSGYPWLDICYISKNNAYDPAVGNTADVEGLMAYGDCFDPFPSAGTCILEPITQIEQILRLFYGKTDDDLVEAGPWGSGFDYSLYADGYRSSGVFDRPLSIESIFSRYMKQFPFLIYKDRHGKYTTRNYESFPEQHLTTPLSFDDDVEVVKLEFSPKAYNSVVLNYWKNHGNSIEPRPETPPTYGPFMGSTFIKCSPQFSQKTLNGAINDSQTTFTITTAGIDPQATPDKFELMLVDKELMEIHTYNDGTGSTEVWRRGACATDPIPHADGTKIYYLRTSSSDGVGFDDQHAESYRGLADRNTICVYETGPACEEVDITYGCISFSDPIRLAEHIATRLTASPLAGTYAGIWDPITNRMTFTSTVPFRIYKDGSGCNSYTSDFLATIIGFVDPSASTALSHTSDTRCWQREAQAAYAYAKWRINDSLVVQGDLIRGSGFAVSDYPFTAVAGRNYRFDRNWRYRKRVRFESGLRLSGILLANTFKFESDIDDYLKVAGESWGDVLWRIIKINQPKWNRLRFLAEEEDS